MTTGEISSESDLFQRVKKRTAGHVGWERIEPSNESGFPDTYFVLHPETGLQGEGTVEFKYKNCAGEPDLSGPLTKGTQKSGLIEYWKMGGRRRWFLSMNRSGVVRLYTTEQAVRAVRGELDSAGLLTGIDEAGFAETLVSALAHSRA